MGRRLLSLHLPCLAVDRLQREDPARRARPFAVTSEEKGRIQIIAVNAVAARKGIRQGVRLADARTVLPGLDAIPDDPTANAQVMQRLVEWCDRYSPLVAHDGMGGIAIDITGCAHLFGGEWALLEDLKQRIERTGYRTQAAIADSLGAAWALCRYSKRTIITSEQALSALAHLPAGALRLPYEVTRELQRVGLTTIGTLLKIPRQSLAARYGPGILRRLDQAFGRAEEPIEPYHPPAPHRAGRTLAEPIGTTEAVECVLLDLLTEICSLFEKAQIGARRLDLNCYRVDGTVARCHVRTSKPARSISHLMRLFAEELNKLDAGFGIERVVLAAAEVDTLHPVQFAFSQFESGVEENSLDELIDRVGMRMGFQQVCRIAVHESYQPEYSVEYRPVTSVMAKNVEWPQSRLRPVCLIDPPVPIKVWVVLPQEWPVQFQAGNKMHRVLHAEGPERLSPEWWHDQPLPWRTRDYYRIEDQAGQRLWIFRESPQEGDSNSPRWYLQGHM